MGKCTAEVARIAGFRVVLYEDREFMLKDIHPQIEIVRLDLEDAHAVETTMEAISKLSHQFIVIVTRGHRCDATCIRAVFLQEKMPEYVGLIGSRIKLGKTWEKMLEEFGSSVQQKIDQVCAPIGLENIGGDQPGQIAVAITAQMIQRLTGGKKRYM